MTRRHLGLALVVALAACGDNEPPPWFRKHVIDPEFRAEGVTVFDVDHDGHLDLVTTELWYAGPTFATAHELRSPRTWDPTMAYSACFHAFHADVDADGFADLIAFAGPGNVAGWCRNPAGQDVHWECHPIAAVTDGESPMVVDLYGSGQPVLVMGIEPERVLEVATPGVLDEPWHVQALSPPDFLPAVQHGLGAVDINGDGRLDVVTGAGWLEQPATATTTPWPWHAVDICTNDCAHIGGFDVSGDGRVDLVGTSPHHYGVWWFEQVGPVDEPQFVRHLIDDRISETHAARLVDLDGDGVPELVTGKRWLAHLSGDPGTDEPVVLVVYRLAREAGEIVWTRVDIDDDSGVGNQFEVVDVDGDGTLDLVIASKKGLFWFEQR